MNPFPVRNAVRRIGPGYTAARAALLAVQEPDATTHGHGWAAWFDRLDESGMADRPHREIARWVADRLGVAPLACWWWPRW